jgi:hypothetical protein
MLASYPFQNIELFLKMRPKIKGPLFIHLSHRGVNRFQLCSILKSAIRFVGYNPVQYNTHSFIIGAATTVVMLIHCNFDNVLHIIYANFINF